MVLVLLGRRTQEGGRPITPSVLVLISRRTQEGRDGDGEQVRPQKKEIIFFFKKVAGRQKRKKEERLELGVFYLFFFNFKLYFRV